MPERLDFERSPKGLKNNKLEIQRAVVADGGLINKSKQMAKASSTRSQEQMFLRV